MNYAILPLNFNNFESLDFEERQYGNSSCYFLKLNSDSICIQTNPIQFKSITKNVYCLSKGYIPIDNTSGHQLETFINNLNEYFASGDLISKLRSTSKKYIPRNIKQVNNLKYLRIKLDSLSKIIIMYNGKKISIKTFDELESLMNLMDVSFTLDISKLQMTLDYYFIIVIIVKIVIVDNNYLPLNDMKSTNSYINENKSKFDKNSKIVIEI